MYFLVPREISRDSATLWMAAVDEPVGALEFAPGTPGAAAHSDWQTWPSGGQTPRVRHRATRFSGLVPRQTYSFTVRANGNTVASARTTTLPDVLPALGEKPLTILLGSCFAHHEDKRLQVGNAFFHMPHAANPDLKIFAGDQVYLDSPWYRYLLPHTLGELRDAFVEHYSRTWGQMNGFARMLREGANFFSSDDHEFWNNSPNFVAFAQNTWTQAGRNQWLELARALYFAFQTSNAVTPFSVPPISFLLADTRVNRDADRTNFMLPRDLAQVEAWINSLQGPGVLVIGQPLLQTSTTLLKGNFGDWNLPDFRQYSDLARIVGKSNYSLVVLTGDVHFGRVAYSKLASGAELVEIISSPLSLVDEAARGEWVSAPPRFPAATAPASLATSKVKTEVNFGPTEGHFLTLELTRRGSGAHLRLRFWPVFSGGSPPANFGKCVWERTLT